MNVLLVHGMFDTGRIFRRLESMLSEHGHHCFAPSLKPNDARHGIADLATKLEAMTRDIFSPTEPFALVGFSMGCLIARYYLYQMNAAVRAKAFFAISGPHRGSLLAHCYPGQGAREMRPESEFLRMLDSVNHEEKTFPIHSYWTPCDLMILPASSSCWAFAINRTIWSPMHLLMPSNREVCLDIVAKVNAIN